MHIHDDQRTSVPCYVRICQNGCVCLGFGPTTIHLERADFQTLLRIMNQAAEKLGVSAKGHPVPSSGRGLPH